MSENLKWASYHMNSDTVLISVKSQKLWDDFIRIKPYQQNFNWNKNK